MSGGKNRGGHPKKINRRGKRRRTTPSSQHARRGERKGGVHSPRPLSVKGPTAKVVRTLCSCTPLPAPLILFEKEMRIAISVLLATNFLNAKHKDWGKISVKIASSLKTDAHTVKGVIEKVTRGKNPEACAPRDGQPPRIKPGTVKANWIVGGLQDGLGTTTHCDKSE